LIKLLRKIAPKLVANEKARSLKYLQLVFEKIKQSFPEEHWAVGKFASSDSEAGKIANALYQAVEGNLDQLLDAVDRP
jgi:hypothetical protein